MTRNEVMRADVSHMTMASLKEAIRLLTPSQRDSQVQARMADLRAEIRHRNVRPTHNGRFWA